MERERKIDDLRNGVKLGGRLYFIIPVSDTKAEETFLALDKNLFVSFLCLIVRRSFICRCDVFILAME